MLPGSPTGQTRWDSPSKDGCHSCGPHDRNAADQPGIPHSQAPASPAASLGFSGKIWVTWFEMIGYWERYQLLALSYIYITANDSMIYIYTQYIDWYMFLLTTKEKHIGGVLRNVCLLCTRLKAIKLIPLADGFHSTLQIITDTSTWSEVVIPFP